MPQFQTIHCPAAPSRLAVRFILVSAGVYTLALSLAAALIHLVPSQVAAGRVIFPPAFWLTSVLLALGSVLLQHASHCVRIERQKPFRRSLVLAVAAGTLFVGLQIYGLVCLIRNQVAEEAQTGANLFIVVIGVLHAMHFSLALLFLVWVTLNALADRYDHEYYWGVTLCAWFWHGLGLIWVCILVVLAIACVPDGFAVI